jgi:hypothetical protein
VLANFQQHMQSRLKAFLPASVEVISFVIAKDPLLHSLRRP